MIKTPLATLTLLTLFCPTLALAQEANQLTDAESRTGWKLLFDGKSPENFRNYKKETISEGWVVEDGALVRKEKGAGDIITKDQYESFELTLEYKISEAGNSGLMFHVTEVGNTPWQTGPEIQVQDNVHGHDPQKAGWLYQLYQPPEDPATGKTVDATRPVNEWNQLYVRIHPDGSEINMNGVQYARFKKGSDDWNKLVAASKFAQFEHFGKPTKGHIALQDHGDVVAYRNIKIREITDAAIKEPVDGELSIKAVPAFPGISWEGYAPIDDNGRPQSFRPIVLTHSNDGSNQIYVAEQHGKIYRLAGPDAKEAKLFIDLTDRIKYSDRQNEEGLLGLAMHPEYRTNGKFYLYYTAKAGLLSTISEFTAKDGQVEPSSERVLMQLEQPFWNHNGGTIAFGQDGFMYIALGDGGAGNDPFGNAQNLNVMLGSILRIDVNSKSDGKAYGIPQDNPFVGQADAQPEIYAYGVRNIWRMSFDQETGHLWAADVGQNQWEEINIITKGGNYGWNRKEGTHPFSSIPAEGSVIDPIWEYDHQIGKSITGGHVYRGNAVPELVGKYLYADYISGKLWALDYNYDQQKVISNMSIPGNKMPVITFGEDEQGEVYFCTVTADGQGIFKFTK